MNWLKVDFHVHTEFSKDSLTRIPDLLKAAKAAGLDRVVITDHNNLEGAKRACELAPDFFIPGEEVLTDRGELLAAFVTRAVPRGTPWREAIAQLREQGAFISVSHPFDLQRYGWLPEQLEELAGEVDALEVLNARCLAQTINDQALNLAQVKGLAGTAGSDAHSLREVGQAHMVLPEFRTAEELKQVIRQGRAEGGLSSPWVHFSSMFAKMVKKSGLWKASVP
jgi:predicted metal-dependent phosphoesterase TrpH